MPKLLKLVGRVHSPRANIDPEIVCTRVLKGGWMKRPVLRLNILRVPPYVFKKSTGGTLRILQKEK